MVDAAGAGAPPGTRKPAEPAPPALAVHTPAHANSGGSSKPYQVRVRAPSGPSGSAKTSTMIRQRASGASKGAGAGHNLRNPRAGRRWRGKSAAPDRKSAVEGKSVAVRVDPRGARYIKKKTNTKTKNN